MRSYPKPGRLVTIQPQPAIINAGEFWDGRRAVAQHKAKAHWTQNRRKCRQIQLLVLDFTAKGKRGIKGAVVEQKLN